MYPGRTESLELNRRVPLPHILFPYRKGAWDFQYAGGFRDFQFDKDFICRMEYTPQSFQ